MQPEVIVQEDFRDVIYDRVQECFEEFSNIKEDFDEHILVPFNDLSQLSEVEANVLRMRAEYKLRAMQDYAVKAHGYYDRRSYLFTLGDDQHTKERVLQRVGVERSINGFDPILAEVRQAINAIEQKMISHGWQIEEVDLYSLCMVNIQQARGNIDRLEFFLNKPVLGLDDDSIDQKIAELAYFLVRAYIHILRVESVPGEEDEGILEPNLEEISTAIKPVDEKLNRVLDEVAVNLPFWSELTRDRTQKIVAAAINESEQEFAQHQRIIDTARQQFAAINGAIDLVRTLSLKAAAEVQEQANQVLEQMLIEQRKAWSALQELEFQYKAQEVFHITVGIDLDISHFDVQAENAQEGLDDLYARLRAADNIASDAHNFLLANKSIFSRLVKQKLQRTTELMIAAASSTRAALDELQKKIHLANGTEELFDDLEEEERQKRLANLLMENPGGILSFIDEVLEKQDLREDLPEIGDSVDISLEQSQNSLAYSNGDVGFHGVRVEEGEIVRSYKVYKAEADHTVTGVALLEQDSTGKVSNRSSKTLDDKQKTEVALKQAQMFLSNYNPGRGDAIMRGKNPEMASKVYAAILFLKEVHPELKQIKIKSWVQDCYGPNTSLRLWGSNEQDYIQYQLDKEVLEHQGKLMAEQLKALTNVKQKGWEFRDNVMKQNCSHQAKMQLLEEHTLMEDQHLFSIRTA